MYDNNTRLRACIASNITLSAEISIFFEFSVETTDKRAEVHFQQQNHQYHEKRQNHENWETRNRNTDTYYVCSRNKAQFQPK